MSNGYAALGKARRNIIKRQKTTDVVTGALGALGTVAAFGVSQAKKADTAWKEYEAGYKALGGEGFEKPKFGKGYFKGPKGLGDVRIGDTMYDSAKIHKAGGFLGSDAAAMLSDEQRSKYLRRTAPGKEVPHLGRVSGPVSEKGEYMGMNEQVAITELGKGGGGFFSDEPDYKRYETPEKTPLPLGQDEPIQESKYGGVDPKPRGPNLGSMWSKFNKFIEAKGSVSGGGTGVNTGVSQIPKNPYSYQNMLNIGTAQNSKSKVTVGSAFDITNTEDLPAFARGGDFITNGPQEILVGDNPGGRERVTIKPLPSKKDEEYKKRNWLESLYENNRRRKKY